MLHQGLREVGARAFHRENRITNGFPSSETETNIHASRGSGRRATRKMIRPDARAFTWQRELNVPIYFRKERGKSSYTFCGVFLFIPPPLVPPSLFLSSRRRRHQLLTLDEGADSRLRVSRSAPSGSFYSLHCCYSL